MQIFSRKEKEPAYYESVLKTPVKNYRVYIMPKVEEIVVTVLLFAVGAFVGYIFYGGLFKVEGIPTTATYISDVAIMAATGVLSRLVLMPAVVQYRVNQQKKALRNQFRDFLDAFVASLSAGKNVSEGITETNKDLAVQYGSDCFMCKELNEMEAAQNNNVRIEVMLKDLGRRSDTEDIADFGDVFEIAYRQGANLKETARKTYNIINDKMSISEEIETKLTSNKTQFYIMMCTPMIVVAMLRFTNESFAANFATPTGILAVTIGIGCMIAAFLLGKKILDV